MDNCFPNVFWPFTNKEVVHQRQHCKEQFFLVLGGFFLISMFLEKKQTKKVCLLIQWGIQINISNRFITDQSTAVLLTIAARLCAMWPFTDLYITVEIYLQKTVFFKKAK